MMDGGTGSATTIRLAEHRVFSSSFKPLYNEGMGLVEEAANYLDGEGRREARRLSRPGAALYAAESMRLTTRLMQLASWLLLQRAANSGEMTREQVALEKSKVRLDTQSPQEEAGAWHDLPEVFRGLVTRSLRLQDRVRRMDSEIYGSDRPEAAEDPDLLSANPVYEQITLLKTAFGYR